MNSLGRFLGSEKTKLFALVFFVSMFVYSLTVARDITTVDSGELAVAIKTLGVPHPPGAPLYMLLAKFGSWFSFGPNLASSIAFVSAIFAALGAGIVALIGHEVLRHWLESTKEVSDKLLFRVSALFGLCFAFSYTPWFYSSVIELYSLANFLLFSAIYLLLLWSRETNDELKDRFLVAATFLWALGCGAHHVTMVLAMPSFVYFVWLKTRDQKLKKSVLLKIALALTLGLSVYLYVPLRALQAPLLNWGQPDNLTRLYNHLTAKIYQQGIFQFTQEEMRQQVDIYYEIFKRQFQVVGIGVALLGLFFWFKKRDALFRYFSVLLVCNSGFWFVYNFSEDKDGYLYPTLLVAYLGILIACVEGYLILRKNWKGLRFEHVGVALALLAGMNLFKSKPIVDKSHSTIARDYVSDMLAPIRPNGLFISRDWQFWSPYLYLRHEENMRPDVTVISSVLMRQFWYVNGYLKQVYPEMMDALKPEVEAYLAELEPVDGEYIYPEETMKKLFGLMSSMVKFHEAKGHSIYSSLPGETPILKDFTWVPEGLVVRLIRQPENFSELAETQLHPWLTGDVHAEDVVRVRIIPHYAKMYLNRARYLYTKQRLDDSLKSLGKAMTLEGESTFSLELLGDILTAKGDVERASQAYFNAIQFDPSNERARGRLTQLQLSARKLPAQEQESKSN